MAFSDFQCEFISCLTTYILTVLPNIIAGTTIFGSTKALLIALPQPSR